MAPLARPPPLGRGLAGRRRAWPVAGGYRAIDSLRLEKGYRVWGADITPEDTPYEAGSASRSSADKVDFIGRDSLADRRTPPALPHSRDPERSRSARSQSGSVTSSSGA